MIDTVQVLAWAEETRPHDEVVVYMALLGHHSHRLLIAFILEPNPWLPVPRVLQAIATDEWSQYYHIITSWHVSTAAG